MNTEHTETGDMKGRILGRIRSGSIAMRPRLHFTLQIAAVIAVAILVLLVSVFIFNFILFHIRINSHDTLLGFGPRGVFAFLRFFPWGFLGLDAGLIILLDWLLRRFRFGYRTPMLYLLASLVVVTAAAGFLLDRGTRVNDVLFSRAVHHRLPPPLNGFYGGARRPPPPGSGFCRCTITAINGNVLAVEDMKRGTELTVILPLDDPRATTTSLSVGDMVMVAGDRDGNTIEAFGVRKIVRDEDDVPGRPKSGTAEEKN